MYAEEKEQCLALGVSRRDPANSIMLFLIAEAAFHSGRAQSADYTSGDAEVNVLILWLRPFSGKAGGNAVLGAILSVLIVGIYCVRSYTFGIDAGQFLVIFDTILEPYALVEGFERMMFDK